MTAVLFDEAMVAATPAPRLRAVPAPELTAVPTVKKASRRPEYQQIGADPLVAGAARLLCVPLRQLYAALWRAGVLEVGA
jgi:hypothetical protein